MPDSNITEENTTFIEKENQTSGEHHHHRHETHHRHHHHSHHRHHSRLKSSRDERKGHHSKHSSHHSHRHGLKHTLHKWRRKIKRWFIKFKRWNERITHKLSPSRIAVKSSERKLSSYSKISNRLFVSMILFAVMAYAAYMLVQLDNTDETLQNAQYTPSETSQLRIQVLSLEDKIKKLEKELAIYRTKYGAIEIEDDE